MKNEKDGIEERDVCDRCGGSLLVRTQEIELCGLCKRAMKLESETATLTTQLNEMREALRGLVEVLETQPSYESFHEYELSGTPDLCRRCGKHIDHAYHSTTLERAKALLDKSGDD